MMALRTSALPAVLVASLLAGCSRVPAPAPAEHRGEPPFAGEVRAAALAYQEWDRVSDHAHRAPTDCLIRPASGAVRSTSEDQETHGQKLYFLYAKDGRAYEDHGFLAREDALMAPGQVLVKESWTAVEVPRGEVPALVPSRPGDPIHPPEYAVAGERAWRTADRAGLFIMLKLDPSTPGTDAGWVYATTSPDGSEVLEAGRIERCMACHVEGTRDRLFGLPASRRERR
jgi:hypothetical protein